VYIYVGICGYAYVYVYVDICIYRDLKIVM